MKPLIIMSFIHAFVYQSALYKSIDTNATSLTNYASNNLDTIPKIEELSEDKSVFEIIESENCSEMLSNNSATNSNNNQEILLRNENENMIGDIIDIPLHNKDNTDAFDMNTSSNKSEVDFCEKCKGLYRQFTDYIMENCSCLGRNN
eukprot:GAHX01003384.1.p1 GENE.GAHX01003384.1~~GAHX01003384.1.p1  ORF type:complete len:147 (+),score=18.01 GAHX01003384.1:38-478(+)